MRADASVADDTAVAPSRNQNESSGAGLDPDAPTGIGEV